MRNSSSDLSLRNVKISVSQHAPQKVLTNISGDDILVIQYIGARYISRNY